MHHEIATNLTARIRKSIQQQQSRCLDCACAQEHVAAALAPFRSFLHVDDRSDAPILTAFELRRETFRTNFRTCSNGNRDVGDIHTSLCAN